MNSENKNSQKKLCIKRTIAMFAGITAMVAGILCVADIFSEALKEVSEEYAE